MADNYSELAALELSSLAACSFRSSSPQPVLFRTHLFGTYLPYNYVLIASVSTPSVLMQKYSCFIWIFTCLIWRIQCDCIQDRYYYNKNIYILSMKRDICLTYGTRCLGDLWYEISGQPREITHWKYSSPMYFLPRLSISHQGLINVARSLLKVS